jgi:solute carrier family 35 protein F5|tara:strand:- start:3376 stop:4809 length:1434 start_codon:yes stop_codon:yes gene_type:complete
MSSRHPPPALTEDPIGFITGTLRDLHGPPLGYAFLLLVCVVWVAGSFLVESLEAQGLSPLLLTYICNALFVVLLPVYFMRKRWLVGEGHQYDGFSVHDGDGDDGVVDGGDDSTEFEGNDSRMQGTESHSRDASPNSSDEDHGTSLLDIPPGFDSGRNGTHQGRRSTTTRVDERSSMGNQSGTESSSGQSNCRRSFAGLTEAERFAATVRASVAIAPLWFAAQLLFNYSLLFTSVTSNSILSTSSAVFTFALSVWLVDERYTNKRLIAILVYVFGSALVTLSDSGGGTAGAGTAGQPMHAGSYSSTSGDVYVEVSTHGVSQKNSNWGNFLCVAAAACYAGYTSLIRYLLPDDPETSMLLFLGTLGLVNFVGVGLVLVLGWILFGAFGDLFEQATWSVLSLAIAKGLLDNVLSDYLWARAVLLTSPTTASVGLSLQIPLAAVVEVLLGRAKWLGNVRAFGLMLSGCGLVVGGFLGVVYW